MRTTTLLNSDMRPWQRGLMDKLTNHEPPLRGIIFVADKDGACGKSWMRFRIKEEIPSTIHVEIPDRIPAGAERLMSQSLIEQDSKALVIECRRGKESKIPHAFCERVKFATKCHVVVLADREPNPDHISSHDIVLIVDEALSSKDDRRTEHINTWKELTEYNN